MHPSTGFKAADEPMVWNPVKDGDHILRWRGFRASVAPCPEGCCWRFAILFEMDERGGIGIAGGNLPGAQEADAKVCVEGVLRAVQDYPNIRLPTVLPADAAREETSSR